MQTGGDAGEAQVKICLVDLKGTWQYLDYKGHFRDYKLLAPNAGSREVSLLWFQRGLQVTTQNQPNELGLLMPVTTQGQANSLAIRIAP